MAERKRNHFVPQWLLRLFACTDTPRGDQVFKFTSDGGRRKGIGNVAVVSYFYGPPENGLEEALSKVDTSDSRLAHHLIAGGAGTETPERLCRLTRLLALRTRAMRDKFSETMGDLLEHMGEHAATEEGRAQTRKYFVRNFQHLLEGEWRKQAEHVRAVVPTHVIYASGWQQLQRLPIEDLMPLVLHAALERVDIGATMASGHVRSLLAALTGEKPLVIPPGWSSLAWSMRRADDEEFVLGDGGGFAIDRGTRKPAHAINAGAAPLAIYCPLSPRAVLVGQTEGAPSLSVSDINRAVVTHSLDTFFACRDTPAERDLVQLLGSARGALPPAEVAEIGRSAWSGRSDPAPSAPVKWAATSVRPSLGDIERLRGAPVLKPPSLPPLRVADADPASDVQRLLTGAEFLAAAYAWGFGLARHAARLSLTVEYLALVDYRVEPGRWNDGIAGIVYPARTSPSFTILVRTHPELTIILCAGTREYLSALGIEG